MTTNQLGQLTCLPIFVYWQALFYKTMNKSLFNPEIQNQNVSHKIVVALQRISEAFKTLLWDQAKQLGLSPIQIQILIFIAYHKDTLCNVSHLAEEFNLTKPTISDAVRVLNTKGYIEKDYSSVDNRSYTIILSTSGKDIVSQTEVFTNPLETALNTITPDYQEHLFQALSQVIYQLNQHGILTVQRTCYGCSFYKKDTNGHFCNLLNKPLLESDIRIDCPEFDAKQTA